MTGSTSPSAAIKFRVWLVSHDVLVSRLLTALTVVAYTAAMYLITVWRYDLGVFGACGDGLTGRPLSQFCSDMRGWLGIAGALAEAIPFIAAAMLAVLGLVYWLFGRWLDLRPSNTWRRETFMNIVIWTAIVGGGALMLMGTVMLVF